MISRWRADGSRSRWSLLRAIALVVTVVMTATLLPQAPAGATAAVQVGTPTAAVDMDGRWGVMSNTADQTVWILRFDPAFGWREVDTIVRPDIVSFGHDVGISTSDDLEVVRIVIGAPEANTAFLYQYTNNVGTNLIDELVAPAQAQLFGSSVDIIGGTIAIGAPGTAGGRGSVFQSALANGQPGTFEEITDPSADADAALGSVVKFADGRIYAGAPGEGGAQEGLIYVFGIGGGLFETIAALTPLSGARFGSVFAVDRGQIIASQGDGTAFHRRGAVVQSITSPAAGPIRDVAISGNMLAIHVEGFVEISTDNGSTGNFTPVGTYNAEPEALQVALGGGHVLIAQSAPAGATLADVLDAQLTPATVPDRPDKILPPIGLSEGYLGNRIDADGNTLVSARGLGGSTGAFIVFERDNPTSPWEGGQRIFTPNNEGAGAVAIQGDTLVALLNGQEAGMDQVAVYQRVVGSDFTLTSSFATQSGTVGRSLSIKEDGQELAIGLPGVAQVEIHTGGPGSWGTTAPQVLVANDEAGNGPQTFGHDVAFGDNVLLVSKPETASLNAPSTLAGSVESWRDLADGNGYVISSTVVPANSAPGDAAGWAIAIEDGVRAIASPGTQTVQVLRSGQGDELIVDQDTITNDQWGFAIDLNAGVLAISDWNGETIAYDVYADAITAIATYQSSDVEQSDYAASTFPVATTGGDVFIGAWLEDEQGRDSGAIYTFTVPLPDPPVFPRTWLPDVAIDGAWAAVGNPVESRVHILFNDGSGWAETQEILGGADDGLGAAVAMEGTQLFVGAPDAGGNVGAITRYDRDATGAYIVGPTWNGTTADDRFASVIDVSNGWVIAGAPADGDGGSAFVNPTDLSNPQLLGSGPDGYGESVAITQTPDFDFAWVGAPRANADTGEVTGYLFTGTTWTQSATNTGTAPGDLFGTALEADAERVAALAPQSGGDLGYIRVQAWGINGVSDATPVTQTAIAALAGGDVVLNGDILVAGTPVDSTINVWSDNDGGVNQLVAILGTPATGRALDADGQWVIGATDAASVNWADLAQIERFTDVGDIPAAPTNKIAPEFGSGEDFFGWRTAIGDDIWVATTGTQAGGAVRIYSTADDSLLQTITDGPDTFGRSVATEGNLLVVGFASSTRVYRRGGPGQPFTFVQSLTGNNSFGESVAIDGNLIVVGSPQSGAPGQVHVYTDDGTAITELPESPLVGGPIDGRLGTSVAVNGNVIVAGAPQLDASADVGVVVTFARPDTTSPFVQASELQGVAVGLPDAFGTSVSFDGLKLAVGAPKEDINGSQGIAFVFDHNGDGTFSNIEILDPGSNAGLGDNSQARWATSVSLSGGSLLIGGPGVVANGISPGEGAVVHYQVDPATGFWAIDTFTVGDALAPDGEAGDGLGFSVALNGVNAVVGAPGEDSTGNDAGAVYRFAVAAPSVPEPDGKLLSVPGADESDLEVGDLFGWAIATDGNRLVVGAPEFGELPSPLDDVGSSGTGGIYVFSRVGDNWVFDQYIANPDPNNIESKFGESVALEGNLVVVGDPAEQFTDQGRAWVFDLAADTAVQITPGDLSSTSQYGRAVAIADGIISVGASGYDFDAAGNLVANLGKVYIWDDVFGTYTIVQEIFGTIPGAQYGRRLAMSDTDGLLVVGMLDNTIIGSVDIFRLQGGVFVPEQTLTGTQAGGQFGFAVDVDEGQVLVGEPNAERAALFTYDDDTQTWDSGQQLNTIVDPGDDYGFAVALDGTVAIVGEPADDDDIAADNGRVHAFGITAESTWEFLDSFVAPDAAARDELGFSVALAGGLVLGGAPLDDNNNGLDAGAVYEFAVTPPPPPLPPVIDPATITIDYQLPETVMPGATTVTIAGAQVASIEGIDGTGATTNVVAASLGSVDLDEPPTGSSATVNPLGEVTLGELRLDALGLDALYDVPLTEFPIDGGWGPILAGTPFDGFPLQTVTLGDVYDLGSVQSIPLRYTDIEASPLRYTDIAAAALGSIPIVSLDLDGDPGTDPYDEWCDTIALQGSTCASLGIDPDSPATLGSIAAAGVNLEATPLRYTPLRYTYIEASPLRYTPLRYTDIQASPLRYTPLRYTDIEASPLRYTPLRYTPLRYTPLRYTPLRYTPLRYTDINATPLRYTPLRYTDNPGAIADCTAIDCTTATIGDAFDNGVLLDFELNDLGDTVMADLRVDDILAGLSDDSVAALQAALEADATATIEDLVDELGAEALGELTLGDIDPEAFEAILELAAATVGDFFITIDPDRLDDFSLADFLLLFIPRTAYEWDEVDLSTINIQSAGLQAPITGSVAFVTTGGEASNDVTLNLTLPDSALIQASSFSLAPTGASITSTTVNGLDVEIEITGVEPGVNQTLVFGLLQGLTLGTTSSFASVEVDGNTDNATDTVTIVEAFEPENGALAGSVPVLANNLYLSHVGTPGDTDFYRITVTEPATSVSLRLGNLGADLDMVVYGPRLGSIIPESGDEVASAPDADFGTGSSGSSLSPVPLNDLPSNLDELQAYGASYFRGTEAEQVDFVAIEPGDYFVQITGFLGASSPEPYSLRAAVTPTVELPCPAREFSFTGGAAGTSAGVSPSANTIVLMNRSRLELIYGPAEAAAVVTAAQDMINFVNGSGAGITADILDVDALAGAGSAYDTWDASPCSVLAVNDVVSSIADAVLGIRNVQNIDHLLVVGGDDIIPFGRVKDGTTIANEQSYTNTFTSGSNNALRTAFSESFVLTDDPYADSAPAPIANSDRVVYVPEIAMGRLVESPAEIVSAFEHFVTFNGQLDPQTGFVAGYDFLDDGAEAVGDRLEELTSPAAVQRLINETWSADQLEAGLAAEPDTALLAAHFDHANALPAAGNLTGDTSDLFSVTDAEGYDYDGAVLFSVGCHGGLSVSDVLIAPTGVVSQDWAQTFLGNGAAAFVGNTGYGYGDDTAVALSERLMAGFADGLDEYATVGEALLYAKQDYSADLAVYGAFDEKALMEATFYGIPFYRLSNTIVPEVVPDPVTEPASTGGQIYTDSFDPVIEVSGNGTEDEIWSTPGDDGEPQVQVTNGYPIIPLFEWEVTQQDPTNPDQLELEARGVVLESLVTRDEINVDPATARAVYDLAANEPNTDASEVTFALSPSINTYLSPEGIRQQVNMAVGAFETTGAGGVGTMRLFEQFDATVYYAQDPNGDNRKPVISQVQSNPAGGTFNLSVQVHDESEVVRTLALVTPMPDPNVATTWQLLELDSVNGTLWQGAADLASPNIQWLVMAVDANGNTAWSMSKDLAFDGTNQTDFAPALANLDVSADPIEVDQAVDFSIDAIDFDGSSDALSLSWDFGDGTGCTAGSGGPCELTQPTDAVPQGQSTASHTYSEAGTYEVTVTVTDSSGLMAALVTTVEVIDVQPPGTGNVRAWSVFQAGTTAASADDILPPLSDGQFAWLSMNARSSSNRPDPRGDFNFGVRGFDLRRTSITGIDVLSETEGIVEGRGRTGRRDNRQWWTFQAYVNDETGIVRLEFWPDGTDPSSTNPTYRFTTQAFFDWQLNVRPR